jgi:hypothetical protein
VTFAAVGPAITATASTFSLTPAGVGHFILLEVVSETAADYATALSSSNVTWSVLVAHTSLSANNVVATVFLGHVTAASAATVTVTLAAGSPTLRISGQEFSTTAGFSAVTLDTSGTVNAATTLSPSLTPGHGSGELYFYYGFNSATATSGSTSGYTYNVDANGNGMCYDAACTSSAQQPAWGASDTISGIAVLLYEATTTPTATAHLAVTPSPHATGDNPHEKRTASLAVTPSPSASAVRTGLVQAVHGSTTGTSLTLTFPAAVTTGDTVIVCVAGYYDGTVSSIALGTTGGTFTHMGGSGGTGGNNAGIYANLGAAQSTATLTITTSTAGILAYAYEVAGVVFFDTLEGGTGTGASWNSGTTAETIPYPHFIAGIGTVVANTGSISGPSSGWVNEAAITDVVGAGSHAIGAVSGYRTAATSGTYSYSGTSGSSSAWGAATAAFLVVPRGGNAWGGYIWNEHASYTGVTATFSIPSSLPSAAANCSVWIGLGNVYQTGIYLVPNTSYPDNVQTYPWSWWFGGGGGAGELWSTSAFPTGPGDSLTLALTCDGTFWYATITNNTLDWSYTEVRSVLGLNVSTWSYNSTTGAPTAWGWIYPVGSAEVVIEQESPYNLPDYGTIIFTGIETTPAASQPPSPQFTVPSAAGGINQYPGPFNAAAGEYTIYFNKGS